MLDIPFPECIIVNTETLGKGIDYDYDQKCQIYHQSNGKKN